MIEERKREQPNLDKIGKAKKAGDKGLRKSSALSIKMANRIFYGLLLVEVVVIALIGYFFLINAKSLQLDSINNDLLPQKQKEFSALNTKYVELKDTNEFYSSLDRSDIDKANQILPDKIGLSDLLINLDALSRSSGFVLNKINISAFDDDGVEVVVKKSINPDDVSSGDLEEYEKMLEISGASVRRVEIGIGVEGAGYSNFKNLLLNIEKNIRLLDVVNFEFSSTAESFNIVLEAYYL